MLLAIDSGNTNCVFAVHDGEDLKKQWRTVTDAARTADEYMVWITQLMALEGIDVADIDGAIIATVVPQALFDLRSLCRRYFKTEPLVIGEPGVEIGITVDVPRPSEVGADRIVNAVAAHETYEGALIVVDFGTATTFDVVNANGNYEGGIISPGVNLSLEALHSAAAQLPRIGIERPQKVIGDGTISAMQSGIYWGYVGMIEGLIARIKIEREDPDMTVISTGGLAPLFRHGTNMIQHVDPDLTLRGLVAIHDLNCRN